MLETLKIEIDKKPKLNTKDNSNILINGFLFMRKFDKYYVERFNTFFNNKYQAIKSFFTEIKDIQDLVKNNDKDMLIFINLLKEEKKMLSHLVSTGELELIGKDNKDYKEEVIDDFMISSVEVLKNPFIKIELSKDLKRYFGNKLK